MKIAAHVRIVCARICDTLDCNAIECLLTRSDGGSGGGSGRGSHGTDDRDARDNETKRSNEKESTKQTPRTGGSFLIIIFFFYFVFSFFCFLFTSLLIPCACVLDFRLVPRVRTDYSTKNVEVRILNERHRRVSDVWALQAHTARNGMKKKKTTATAVTTTTTSSEVEFQFH